MIDFSKITKTLDGCKAYHVNQRFDDFEVIHEFAIVHPRFGASIEYYNEKGNRVTYDAGKSKWVERNDGKFQIVKPKKKVSVTRWISYHKQTTAKNGVSCRYHNEDPSGRHLDDLLDVVEVTKEIEVDE